ncbi:PTS sugar transporter subunit IIA [Alkalibaculum sp. M08DMB]|uniref:PTS sugar transporter subunit IIA n=1 Tax=Alkalibaculum sporogenes TaxID=2655001 RepID=A0A6A7KAY0_9FIRM|nr:PTS sugar transporter subunit IIA [Alkalibaculum sporogenes]MPW26522.1 PTS sugar transporter subunit IIA [Alkalibaculum sporogenes]
MNLRISDVMTQDSVNLESESFKDKDELFRHLASLLYKSGKIQSQEIFVESLYEREELGSTYMGNFIALPHGKSMTVNNPGIAFCRCMEGFAYESQGEVGQVKLIFVLAIPKETDPNDYLKVLSMLAKLLMHDEFINELYSSLSYEDVIRAVKTYESIVD